MFELNRFYRRIISFLWGKLINREKRGMFPLMREYAG